MLVTAALNDSQVGFPEPAKRGYALLLFGDVPRIVELGGLSVAG
jgi:hypothetical protein